MKLLFVSLGAPALLLAGCDDAAPQRTLIAATTVDYRAPVEQLAAEAQISATEAPSFYVAAQQGAEEEGVQRSIMAIVPNDQSPPAADFEPATGRELVAFAAEHPDLIGNRNGVCAEGSWLMTEDGLDGHPVVSQRDGRLYAGVWRNCHWRLLVARNNVVVITP